MTSRRSRPTRRTRSRSGTRRIPRSVWGYVQGLTRLEPAHALAGRPLRPRSRRQPPPDHGPLDPGRLAARAQLRRHLPTHNGRRRHATSFITARDSPSRMRSPPLSEPRPLSEEVSAMRDGSVVRRHSTGRRTWAQAMRPGAALANSRPVRLASRLRQSVTRTSPGRHACGACCSMNCTSPTLSRRWCPPAARSRLRAIPHALAIALAERHSWTPADLRRLTRRLGLSLRAARRQPTPRSRTTPRASLSGPRASRRKES